MQIKVLFDKDALERKLQIGWGVSFLIDEKILFDTGENGRWLMKNMDRLGVDVEKIKGVVISHDHWDHTGGLWDVLSRRKGLVVYACPHFSKRFKEKVKDLKGELIEADNFIEISRHIFVTGEIAGTYNDQYMPEQALVLRTDHGLSVITGCAHPGIVKMVEKVIEKFSGENIYAVWGGFHLMQDDKRSIEIVVDDFKKTGIKKAGPTHCSGEVAENIFKNKYGDDFIDIKVGQTLDI